jgi:hypothetical protein
MNAGLQLIGGLEHGCPFLSGWGFFGSLRCVATARSGRSSPVGALELILPPVGASARVRLARRGRVRFCFCFSSHRAAE